MIWNALYSPEFWKAVVMFATSAGIQFSPEQTNAIVGAGLALMGIINAFKHATGK